MQLCALKTYMRISRNLKMFVDLMRVHRFNPELSPSPLQTQASGQRISVYLNVGGNISAWLETHIRISRNL